MSVKNILIKNCVNYFVLKVQDYMTFLPSTDAAKCATTKTIALQIFNRQLRAELFQTEKIILVEIKHMKTEDTG